MENLRPTNERPEHVIKGGAAVRRFEILNDKRHILTKDSEGNVTVYDVLKVSFDCNYFIIALMFLTRTLFN